MNRMRACLQPRIGDQDAGGSAARGTARDPSMLRSRGESLRAELTKLEAQGKADLEYAQIHGTFPDREGTCKDDAVIVDEERHECLRTLSAAALAVVEQAMDNPEVFEGIFDQARRLLSNVGADGDTEDAGADNHAYGNSRSNGNNHEQIHWAELEREGQDDQQEKGGEAAGDIQTDGEVRDNNWRELLNASQQAAANMSPLATNGERMVGREQDCLRHNEDLDDEFFGGASWWVLTILLKTMS
ncbi:hypothetical protein VPH35_067000 [Triticum aestivum]